MHILAHMGKLLANKLISRSLIFFQHQYSQVNEGLNHVINWNLFSNILASHLSLEEVENQSLISSKTNFGTASIIDPLDIYLKQARRFLSNLVLKLSPVMA